MRYCGGGQSRTTKAVCCCNGHHVRNEGNAIHVEERFRANIHNAVIYHLQMGNQAHPNGLPPRAIFNRSCRNVRARQATSRLREATSAEPSRHERYGATNKWRIPERHENSTSWQPTTRITPRLKLIATASAPAERHKPGNLTEHNRE